MRLYDTSTRSLVELPPAPGPVRMYFCGPTVYARAHIGNARPFVVGMWLRSWLRETGYEAWHSDPVGLLSANRETLRGVLRQYGLVK